MRFSKHKLIKIAVSLLFLCTFLIPNFAFAASRGKIILFCTDWNVKCRQARPIITSVASNFAGVADYQEYNIDLNTTQDYANEIKIEVPKIVPFIYVLNRNGDITAQFPYQGQPPNQLRSQIGQALSQ